VINSMHTDLPNHPQAHSHLHTGCFQFVRPFLGAWSLYGLLQLHGARILTHRNLQQCRLRHFGVRDFLLWRGLHSRC
jgi:hypothetical protein